MHHRSLYYFENPDEEPRNEVGVAFKSELDGRTLIHAAHVSELQNLANQIREQADRVPGVVKRHLRNLADRVEALLPGGHIEEAVATIAAMAPEQMRGRWHEVRSTLEGVARAARDAERESAPPAKAALAEVSP